MTNRKLFYASVGVVFAMFVIVAIASACAPVEGRQAVTDATFHDFLFACEHRKSGAYACWLRNDSLGVYCLPDERMIDLAYGILGSKNTEVVGKYKSFNIGLVSSEYPRCANLEGGAVTVTTYVLLDLWPAGDMPDPPFKKGSKLP